MPTTSGILANDAAVSDEDLRQQQMMDYLKERSKPTMSIPPETVPASDDMSGDIPADQADSSNPPAKQPDPQGPPSPMPKDQQGPPMPVPTAPADQNNSSPASAPDTDMEDTDDDDSSSASTPADKPTPAAIPPGAAASKPTDNSDLIRQLQQRALGMSALHDQSLANTQNANTLGDIAGNAINGLEKSSTLANFSGKNVAPDLSSYRQNLAQQAQQRAQGTAEIGQSANQAQNHAGQMLQAQALANYRGGLLNDKDRMASVAEAKQNQALQLAQLKGIKAVGGKDGSISFVDPATKQLTTIKPDGIDDWNKQNSPSAVETQKATDAQDLQQTKNKGRLDAVAASPANKVKITNAAGQTEIVPKTEGVKGAIDGTAPVVKSGADELPVHTKMFNDDIKLYRQQTNQLNTNALQADKAIQMLNSNPTGVRVFDTIEAAAKATTGNRVTDNQAHQFAIAGSVLDRLERTYDKNFDGEMSDVDKKDFLEAMQNIKSAVEDAKQTKANEFAASRAGGKFPIDPTYYKSRLLGSGQQAAPQANAPAAVAPQNAIQPAVNAPKPAATPTPMNNQPQTGQTNPKQIDPSKLSGADLDAYHWALANPNDKRAAQIMLRLHGGTP